MEKNAAVIDLQKVSKYYGAKAAVKDVSLQVAKGEIFGFLGPNGAGKTTTIRMMLDVQRPTSGTVRLFGDDSRNVKTVHQRIGYLSGDMVIDANLTGRQYLEFVAGVFGMDCDEARDSLASRLDAELDKKIGDYSRGNKQKIGLISALMHQPELLILDEPTSGFDPLVQETFAALIREFRDGGGTVFMSSHILAEVQQLCDRVAFIKDGSIIELTDVASLTDGAAKRIRVKAAAGQIKTLRDQMTNLQAISLLDSVDDEVLECTYGGDIQILLQLLAFHDLHDLTIREPELEELFMQFYGDDHE